MGTRTVFRPIVEHFCDVCGKEKDKRYLVTCNICGKEFCKLNFGLPGCGKELYTFPEETILMSRQTTCREEHHNIISRSEMIGAFVCSICLGQNSDLKERIEKFEEDCETYRKTHDMCSGEYELELNMIERVFIKSLCK
jgi:transcription elongation factor Elf1